MAALPDYYTGFTEAEVLAIFTAAKEELKTSLAAYSESGTQVTKQRVEECHQKIAACQAALRRFNPTTYGKPRSMFIRTGPAGYIDK